MIGSYGYGHPIETWTPTLSNATGVDASAMYPCNFQRVGQVIVFWGKMDLDLTSGNAFNFDLSLPVSAIFSTDTDVVGHLTFAGNLPAASGGIIANTSTNKLLVTGRGSSNSSLTYYFHGVYKRY